MLTSPGMRVKEWLHAAVAVRAADYARQTAAAAVKDVRMNSRAPWMYSR